MLNLEESICGFPACLSLLVRRKGLDTLWCRHRRAAAEQMSAGHLHFYGSSPMNKNNPNPSPAEVRFGLFCFGTPEGTRTPDLFIRSRSLYPTELPAHLPMVILPHLERPCWKCSAYFLYKKYSYIQGGSGSIARGREQQVKENCCPLPRHSGVKKHYIFSGASKPNRSMQVSKTRIASVISAIYPCCLLESVSLRMRVS